MLFYRKNLHLPKNFVGGGRNNYATKKLHLGCGFTHLKGYVNLDISRTVKPDILHDLMKIPYPFPDNFFDEIISGNVFGELEDWQVVVKEMYRISKPGALWHIAVPYYHTPSAFNPNHKHFFHGDSFNLFINPKHIAKVNPTYGYPYYYDIIEKEFVPAHFLAALLPNRLRNFVGQILGNFVSRIWFTMKVIK